MERRTRFIWTTLLASVLVSSAQSFVLSYAPDRIYVPKVMWPVGTCELAPDHVWQIGGTSTQAQTARQLALQQHPNWTVTCSGEEAPGQVVVKDYEAWLQGRNGSVVRAGALLEFDYLSTSPSLSSYRFLQIIYTNSPYAGATSPYIDPFEADDELPFYWTGDEEDDYRGPGSYTFFDSPYRGYDGTYAITWAAALFLTQYDAAQNSLVIRDGVYWGWGTVGVAEPTPGLWSPDKYAPVDKMGKFATVPEPTSLVTLVIGALALMRRGRK